MKESYKGRCNQHKVKGKKTHTHTKTLIAFYKWLITEKIYQSSFNGSDGFNHPPTLFSELKVYQNHAH